MPLLSWGFVTKRRRVAIRLLASALLALLSAGSALAQAVPVAVALPASQCDYTSIVSPPGQQWMHQHGWRYADPTMAQLSYRTLALGLSPWPDWFTPPFTALASGTRFQMAIGPEHPTDPFQHPQSPQTPGGWGTFALLETVADVRVHLAVQRRFKKEIDRVVTYEVTQPLPVLIGPVGPQVDSEACELLEGRWSQIQMIVPWDHRMDYLRVIEVRNIQ